MLAFIEKFFYLSVPTDEDIKQAMNRFFPNPDQLDISSTIESIQTILQRENRYLLNVFSLDRDDDVAKTIFKAIFASMYLNEIKFTVILHLFDSEKKARQVE
jgi:hypothetical protein